MPTHVEQESLIACYVLSALEQGERAVLEAHLPTCRRCRQRLGEMKALAVGLASATEEREPPAGLRQKILVAAMAEGSGASVRPVTSPPSTERWWRIFTRPVAVAAALGVLLLTMAGLAVWIFSIQSSLDRYQELTSISYEGITILGQAEQWWKVQGTEAAPHFTGTLAYSSQQSAACLLAWNLRPSEGKTYHAWTVKDGVPTLVGTLWAMRSGHWIIIHGDLDQLDAVTITLDEARRPSQPLGPVVARVSLSTE